MRAVSTRAAVAAALLATQVTVSTQSPKTAFSAEDMLRIASISVIDVTDDGSRLVTTTRRPIDNDFTDHRRYGDPTYLAPSRVTLEVVDLRTGAREALFKELVNVRDAAWAPDGRRLAVLLAREATGPDAFPTTALYIWDATEKALASVTPAQPIAVNSSLAWTPDGGSLVVALRSPQLDREARTNFKMLTDGPIVVHKSSDPFLEWDLLNRSARTRTIAVLNPADGSIKPVLPQGRISSYQVARDGTFMTVMEDVTAKTDYDTIGGTEDNLKHRTRRSRRGSDSVISTRG